MKIKSYLLCAMLNILALPVFSNPLQAQETVQAMHFKSIACDDSGEHCMGLSHNPEKKYSLMLYRTDNAGENWDKLNVNPYTRIGSDEMLDGFAGMGIACDQYLQNCLMGVTISHGQAYVFYGTKDGGQTWKGTIIWHEPTQTLKPSYIVQLACNPSTASQCHMVTNTNDMYTLKITESDPATGLDTLNLTMHPMFNH